MNDTDPRHAAIACEECEFAPADWTRPGAPVALPPIVAPAPLESPTRRDIALAYGVAFLMLALFLCILASLVIIGGGIGG